MDYSDFIGRYCVVRARDASPHAGIVEDIDGRTVKMREARRLWRLPDRCPHRTRSRQGAANETRRHHPSR